MTEDMTDLVDDDIDHVGAIEDLDDFRQDEHAFDRALEWGSEPSPPPPDEIVDLPTFEMRAFGLLAAEEFRVDRLAMATVRPSCRFASMMPARS